MNDPQVHVLHIRACALCMKGARAWFEKHGLDFRTFIRQGYPASAIEAVGDELGNRVAAKAREMNKAS